MIPQIYKPQKALEDFVMCYWSLEGEKKATPEKNTIIPDGTMKLIFHYGDLYKHHSKEGVSNVLPRCFLIGQLTEPYIVEPVGKTRTFFVRFKANGFIPFSPILLKDIENKAISIRTLYGKEGIELENKIINTISNAERIEIIEAFLLRKLQDKKNIDHIVQDTIDTIFQASGQVIIGQLSNQYSIHRRSLSRKFSSTVGISPKQLSKIIRLQTSLQSLLRTKTTKFTDVIYENEYFDQAHFIKDFKEFTGHTPKEFYGDDFKMSLIFESKK